MNEAITAIELHMQCLKQDYEKIVVTCKGNKTGEFFEALDAIKSKMNECETALELLKNI